MFLFANDLWLIWFFILFDHCSDEYIVPDRDDGVPKETKRAGR